MAEHYQPGLDDYISLLKRRWVLLVVPFVIISTLGVSVAMMLPPVYKSTGVILVESQRIPDSLVRTTITSYIEERIQIIKQRVMTRENLLALIDEFGLYNQNRNKMTVADKIVDMRRRIEVMLIKEGATHADAKNITFSVGFEHDQPDVAYQVTNKLVTLFLEENVRTRTKRASETTEFLTQEAAKFKHQLEKIEAEIAAYKQKFGDALPEHLDLRMKMLERTESEIKTVQRDILTTQEEIRFLDVQLSAEKMGVGASDPVSGDASSPAQQLAKLKVRYAQASSVYSASHPEVRSLKRKIDSLSKVVNSETSSTETLRAELTSAKMDRSRLLGSYSADHPEVKRIDARIAKLNRDIHSASKNPSGALSEATQSIAMARVQAKITAAQERLASLDRQRDELKSKRKKLEQQIIQTPQVQRALVSLNRDYESTLKKYQEIQGKQMEAKLAESLEENKKAERFSLLEPPIIPEKPVKPNRKKISMMAIVLGLAGGGGLVMLLESMDKRIRGINALIPLIRQRPLVIIPYITTREEVERRKLWLKMIIIGAAAGFILLLIAAHFLVMPLDLLMLKVMAKLGG